jgi:hypothetical protein
VTEGGGFWFTVIVKEHVLVLPTLSVVVHNTVDAPSGKVEPDGGAQDVETIPEPSETVG